MTVPVAAVPSIENPIDVLLVGLGSIGSIYAWLLERSGKARVTAVARSNYELYATTGVKLETTQYGSIEGWKPYRVVKSQQEALADGTRYAYGLITTKCLLDVLPTAELVKDALASGQVEAWSLIQNGLGVENDFYKSLEPLAIPLLSSLAWVGIMTNDDGSVVKWHGVDTTVVGLYPPTKVKVPSPRAQSALDTWVKLFQEGGSNTLATDDVVAVRYSKNIWNCVWSSIQGLVRTRPSSWAELSPEAVAPIKRFIREVVDVGFAAGHLKEGMTQHPFGQKMGDADQVAAHCWDQIVPVSLARKATGGGHKMSLWVDVEKGRPTEVEVITGAVSRLAEELGVPTPLLDFTYALMRGQQVDILDQIAVKKAAAA